MTLTTVPLRERLALSDKRNAIRTDLETIDGKIRAAIGRTSKAAVNKVAAISEPLLAPFKRLRVDPSSTSANHLPTALNTLMDERHASEQQAKASCSDARRIFKGRSLITHV